MHLSCASACAVLVRENRSSLGGGLGGIRNVARAEVEVSRFLLAFLTHQPIGNQHRIATAETVPCLTGEENLHIIQQLDFLLGCR